MKKGKIISKSSQNNTCTGEFSIDFQNSSLGPYNYIFDRERLYYNEDTNERGSFFFPLKTESFNNTEIFLETNDIIVAAGERGSFSGGARIFVEVVNLKTQQKHRLYPDEVSLIYNSKTSVIIYYGKSEKHKKLELDKNTLEKVSETTTHLDAFFKLFYNHTTKKYGRLVYKANSKSHIAGYFVEKEIESKTEMPDFFERNDFKLISKDKIKIDVWEVSLTGII